MAVANSSEAGQLAIYLRTVDLTRVNPKQLNQQLSLSTSERKEVVFISKLLEVFGQRYAQAIMDHIDKKLKDKFWTVWTVLTRVQNALLKGIHTYSPADFQEDDERREIAAFMDASAPTGVSQQDYYQQLKELSYATLSCPLRILSYREPELTALARIEAARETAFAQLLSQLAPPQEEEKRPISSALDYVMTYTLKPAEEIAVTALYLHGEAVHWDKKPVHFRELIADWGLAHPLQRQALTQQLTLSRWVEESPPSTPPSFSQHRNAKTFREYLVCCTLEALKENLAVVFTDSTRKILAEVFSKQETVRLDLDFFTSNLSFLYNMRDLPDRSSKYLLLGVQLYVFLRQTQGVRLERWAPLFEMLIHRDHRWESKTLPGFISRDSNQTWAREEDPSFTAAFEALSALLDLVKKTGAPFADPDCWPLFYFLLGNEKRDVFVAIFEELSKNQAFTFSIRSIYAFCVKNGKTINGATGRFFAERYLIVLKAAQEKEMTLRQPERLFIDPPIEVLPDWDVITKAAKKADQLLAFLRFHQYPLDEDLLYHYCLRGKPFVFEFLKEAQAIGIRQVADPKFLRHVLQSEIDPSIDEAARSLSEEKKRVVQAHTATLQGHFSDREIFSLHLEIIRLVAEGKEERLEAACQALVDLKRLSPFIPGKYISFLLRCFLEEEPRQQLAKLSEVRAGWANDREQIASNIYPKIMQGLRLFVAPLAAAYPHEDDREACNTSLINALLPGYFPPLQPLTDYFRIRNITPQGIHWQDEHYKTHLGQLKLILGSNLGVYFHWDILNDHPTLFFSFYNIETKAAHSAFIPLRISAHSLEDSDERRRAVYSLLYHLSSLYLPEESDGAGNEEQIALFENDLTGEEIAKMKTFITQVKVAYRAQFLSAIGARSLSEPSVVSAPGSVPEGFVDECFSQRRFHLRAPQRHQPEPLNLTIPSSQGGSEELPITYQVQSAEEVKELDASSGGRDYRAVEVHQEEGSFVTLSVADGKVKSTLRYPPEALKDQTLFRCYFNYHYFLLFSVCSRVSGA